jgi:radical SAM protein with 4Fe4S-binding SPASM domain
MQCFGGKSFLSLKPNGDITPCSYLNDYFCGNINEQSLSEIWGSLSMLCFSVEILKESCEHAEKCRGGCKAISRVFNRSDKCDPYCWVM